MSQREYAAHSMGDTTTAPPSPGARLREVRLEQALSLVEVARRTNIRVEHLRALERGTAHWPDPAYERAFARSYAAVVGLDPAAVVREPERLVPRGAAAVPPGDRAAGEEPALASARPAPAPPAADSRWLSAAVPVLVAVGVLAVALVIAGGEPETTERPEPSGVASEREPRRGAARSVTATPVRSPAQELGGFPAARSLAPRAEALELRLRSPTGIAVCVLADGELAATELPAGGTERLSGKDLRLVFPEGFDPEDLTANLGGQPITIADTQGPAAVRIRRNGTADPVPFPPEGCG